MRLGRLVAAGLVAGAVAGFVGALLRPRTVQTYRPDADHPATGARGDLAATRPLVVPDSRTVEPAAGPEDTARSGEYALATSAPDEAPDGLLSEPGGGGDDEPADPDAAGTTASIDVDVPADRLETAARLAAAPSHGANG